LVNLSKGFIDEVHIGAMTPEEKEKRSNEEIIASMKRMDEIVKANPLKGFMENIDKVYQAGQQLEGKLKAQRLLYKAWLDKEVEKIGANNHDCQLFLFRQKKELQDLIYKYKEEGNGYDRNNVQKMLIEILEPTIEHYQEIEKLILPVHDIHLAGNIPANPAQVFSENIVVEDIPAHSKRVSNNPPKVPNAIDLKWQTEVKRVIDHLIELKRFDAADRNILLLAFYDEKFTRKIIWYGAKNLFGTMVFDLRANNIVKAQRQVIATWIEKYFLALGEYDTPEPISYRYAYNLLGKSETARRVKKSHPDYIDIIGALTK
jgi:hypothetical protein